MRAGTWADRAEASWLSDELGGKPHVALACGHLSAPGSGPLAGAGYGYCRYHGVTRIAPGAEITSPGDTVDAGGTPVAAASAGREPVTGVRTGQARGTRPLPLPGRAPGSGPGASGQEDLR
jgi:hypothetical protein